VTFCEGRDKKRSPKSVGEFGDQLRLLLSIVATALVLQPSLELFTKLVLQFHPASAELTVGRDGHWEDAG
jgi:hypothetical protein